MLPEICSRCNQPVLDTPIESPSSTTLSAEEEIAFIVSASARLDNIIAQLHALRASRLQRLNTLRSQTRDLPPEILSTIFHHYIPRITFDDFDPEYKRSPSVIRRSDKEKTPLPTPAPPAYPQITVLGAVSRRWRNVAYTTPQLWAAVHVRVDKEAIQDKAHLIRLYLTNVGDTTFSLKLDPSQRRRTRDNHPVLPNPISEVELQPIFNSIWERAEKIHRFSCTHFPGSWLGLLSHKFQKLEYLSLHQLLPMNMRTNTRPEGPQITPWSSIPRLRKIALTGVGICIPKDSPPCNSVTVLHLYQPDLITCFHLLSLCPNLIECLVKPLTEVTQFTGALPLLPNTLAFPHMKNFQVHCAFQRPFYELFPRLNLPSLETLGLGAMSRDERDEVSNILSFIHSLPASWSTLDLNYPFADSQGIVTQILEAGIPENVSNLNLLYSNRMNLQKMLQALKCRYPPRQRVTMPGLNRISILNWQNGYQVFPLFGDPSSPPVPQVFLEMLLDRRSELDGQFLLEMVADNGVYWGPYQKDLKSMILGGLQVRIMVAGTLIPELREVYDELEG